VKFAASTKDSGSDAFDQIGRIDAAIENFYDNNVSDYDTLQ
jgi:hypothetical protein